MGDPVILWLRALHPIYDPLTAVRAFGRLRSDYPRAKLILAGPDRGLHGDVLKLARELSLTDAIELPGRIDPSRVPMLLELSDLFLNTTTAESFGVSLTEAAAVGLPLVSTDPGEIPHRWRSGVDALLAPVGDADRLADLMRQVLGSPDLRRSLTRRARERAELSAWHRLSPQWGQLLREVSFGRRTRF
jgi:glycosyltransferase involved in cell wall biosynthesis